MLFADLTHCHQTAYGPRRLRGEKPYLLKIDVDELWDGKVIRSRVLYGDLTTQAFTDVISLDLVVR